MGAIKLFKMSVIESEEEIISKSILLIRVALFFFFFKKSTPDFIFCAKKVGTQSQSPLFKKSR